MIVHHLNCATMRPPLGRLVVNREGRMVCHCLLVETDDGLLLCDTGLGTADVAAPKDRLGRRFLTFARPRLDLTETAAAQVERLGYARSDVRHIVLTHLDLDHAGGLSDFPDATVHVLEAERAAAAAPATYMERHRYSPAQWAHGPRWKLHRVEDGERWFGFERVRLLAGPDVLLVPLIGHTRGHAGVAVRTDDKWLLHAGDAYFHEDQMTSGRCPPGLRMFQRLTDTLHELRVSNQARLAELHAMKPEVRVFSAHDPAEYGRLAASSSPARVAPVVAIRSL